MRLAIKIIILIAIIMGAFILLSPYRWNDEYSYKAISSEVMIKAPIDSVYAYLGNSGNARNWSIFVDHITTLNSAQVPDGMVGSKRRAFQEADETGLRWDEEILIAKPNEQRRLICFDLVEFPLSVDTIYTDQWYKKTQNGTQTNLTFTVFYMSEPGLIDHVKTKFAAYQIKSIFDQNLENIKQACEQK